MRAVVNKKEKQGYFRQVDVYKTLGHRHCQNSPTPKHILQISPSTPSSIFLRFKNVGRTRKMQQNPPHCQAPANAPTVAQQGPNVRQSHPLRRTSRTRSRLRRNQLPAVRRPGHLLEPPGFQEASGSSRRGVRVHQSRPFGNPLRRVGFRRSDPVHIQIRVAELGPVHEIGRFSELLPYRNQNRAGFMAGIPAFASWVSREINLVMRLFL